MNVADQDLIILQLLIDPGIKLNKFIPGPADYSLIFYLKLPDIHDGLLQFPDRRRFNIKSGYSVFIRRLSASFMPALFLDRHIVKYGIIKGFTI